MDLARKARAVAEDKKGVHPVLLNVSGLSSVTDFYLIVSGLNMPHLKALGNAIHVSLKEIGAQRIRQSGDMDSGWLILDYSDVVIHLFTEEKRDYYAIEDLWSDAERVE